MGDTSAASAVAARGGTDIMGLAIVLLILALIFGVVGFIVEALQWIIVIALVLLVVSAVTGGRARRGTRP
jgi:ABC-type multidrug transport system permease subunit